MEELINRLFEELAKQTARAAFAEKDRDQYREWMQMYQQINEKQAAELKELKKNDTDGT